MSKRFTDIPVYIRKKLAAEAHKALRTMRYSDGIAKLEEYKKSYVFDDQLLHALGVLYDHRGIQVLGQFCPEKKRHVSKSRKQQACRYFKKAERIFSSLLERNPKNVHALFRLGVLAELRGKYSQALRFKLKAHRIGIRDKKKRIPLLIGFTYLKIGNKKEAEKWLKKDFVALGNNDPAPNFNMLLFYLLAKDYVKALPYALKVEGMLKQKTVKGFTGKKIISLWEKRIQEVKDKTKFSKRKPSK